MFLFVLYAITTWYLVCRLRRTWRGAGVLLGALIGLLGVAFLHIKLNEWTHGAIYLRQLQTLLYPYIGLVLLVGAFLWWLPSVPSSGFWCRKCRYDLAGLDVEAGDAEVRCPECGAMRDVPDHVRYANVELIGLPDPETVPSRRAKKIADELAAERAARKRRLRGTEKPARITRGEDAAHRRP